MHSSASFLGTFSSVATPLVFWSNPKAHAHNDLGKVYQEITQNASIKQTAPILSLKVVLPPTRGDQTQLYSRKKGTFGIASNFHIEDHHNKRVRS